MNSYTVENYKELVEKIEMSGFQNYMKAEIELIKKLSDADSRTFIELGAGYGRITSHVHSSIGEYIGVELNDNMYTGLSEYSKNFPNVYGIKGNMLDINKLLQNRQMTIPVVMLLQNTLGVIEDDLVELFQNLKLFFENRSGEIIISVLRAERLKDFGLELYRRTQKICGEYDPKSSDLPNGIFVSKTNYYSKWWAKKEIIALTNSLKGELTCLRKEPEYYIFQISM